MAQPATVGGRPLATGRMSPQLPDRQARSNWYLTRNGGGRPERISQVLDWGVPYWPRQACLITVTALAPLFSHTMGEIRRAGTLFSVAGAPTTSRDRALALPATPRKSTDLVEASLTSGQGDKRVAVHPLVEVGVDLAEPCELQAPAKLVHRT